MLASDGVATSGGYEVEVDSFLDEWVDKKVPVPSTFSQEMKLDRTNYSIWRVTSEAVLETYDLGVMVKAKFSYPNEYGMTSSFSRKKIQSRSAVS